MFFIINVHRDAELIGQFIIETANQARCDAFVEAELQQRPHRKLDVARVPCEDDEIPPKGWRYQKEQLWVEGDDPGWVRLWQYYGG